MLDTSPANPLRLDVATLSGLALDWAVAVYDPRNVGLRFEVTQGVLCAVSDEPDGTTLRCLYFHGPNVRDQMAARHRLGLLLEHAQSYSPTDSWPNAGQLLEVGRVEVGPDGETLWRAKAGDIELRAQPSARLALLRAFVLKNAGPTLEVPSELASVLSPRV